ncbi:MAG: alpha-ribazole phosphatase [bacterium]|nr:alpha-ribazole phosphatase [bacterium]
MEIYLVRHTTPDVPKGVCYGQTDLELVSGFEAEIRDSIQYLPKELDLVYSSPLKRCRILAEAISPGAVIYNSNLKEYDFGNWEMKKWDDIPKEDVEPWMSDYVNIPAPNGESLLTMSKRIKVIWNEIQDKSDVQNVAVVCHSGVIRIIRAIHEGTPLKDCFSYKMNYGEVFKITL